MEYTPGPWKWGWKIDDRLEADCGVHSEHTRGQAVSICRAPRYEKEEQWKANARLICGAQDLLGACKALIRWSKTATPTRIIQELDPIIKQAKLAISKAEGK